MATGGMNDADIALENPNEKKRSRGESSREEDDGDRKRPRPGVTEGSKPDVRPPLQLFLEVKPWQPVIIPPHPGALGDFSTQEEDIHLVIRMQHMPRIREVSDLGANRRQIMEKYPSPYEWPEPNVLGRLDQLGIQPRFWNPWIKVIDVEDIMVAVCKCYETEPWVREKIELTQDDIHSIESWITKDRWKLSSSYTGKVDDLRQFVIQCLALIYIEGRKKLKTMIEATKNGSNGSSDTILSILYLSELPVEKWYPVGLGLGVKEANLEKISEEFKKEEYAVCMFDDWLRNHAREACYPPMKLVAVLLDAGEMVSAKMVCQKYDICEPHPPVLPTLQDLCLLPLVDNEWREVGEQLGVSDDDLDKAAECDDPQREMFRRCLEREMQRQAVPVEQRLLEALSRGPELAETVSSPELAELTKALYAVGDPELAEKIIQEHKVRVLNIPHPTISSNEHLKIHWHKFGKSLGFNVQNIEGKHSEIFKVWLERNPNATYDKLVSDLSVIGDHKGARTVCRKFGVRLPDASVVALYGRKTITRQPQVQKSTSKEGPARNVGKDEKPTLPLLLKFPKGSGPPINIPQTIGNCSDFGTFLLDDANGTIVEAITEKHRGNVKEINKTILQEWLKGRGKEPFTWETLVKVLRDADLSTLADDIEHEL